MAMKKIAALSILGVATFAFTHAFAATKQTYKSTRFEQKHFSVGVNVGYAFQNWNDALINSDFTTPVTESDRVGGKRGGFAYGVNADYLFNRYIGLELGWTKLPRSMRHSTLVDFKNSWAGWFAAKLMVPVSKPVSAFFKAGISYRRGKILFKQTDLNTEASMKEWAPLLAVGLNYNFSSDWSANLTYTHLVGGKIYGAELAATATTSAQGTEVVVPAVNMIALGVIYNFAV